MQSTQEIAELMLDSGRNALLALDIKISIATLGIGSGALLAGLFGMNVCLPPVFAIEAAADFIFFPHPVNNTARRNALCFRRHLIHCVLGHRPDHSLRSPYPPSRSTRCPLGP